MTEPLAALLPGPLVPPCATFADVAESAPRLTRRGVDELGPDYDLAAGSVRRLRVERSGEALTASFQVVAPRRFAAEDGAPPARPDAWLDGVTGVAFGWAPRIVHRRKDAGAGARAGGRTGPVRPLSAEVCLLPFDRGRDSTHA